MIEIVSATRMTETEFWQKAALGLSLRRIVGNGKPIAARVAYENKKGLPEVYNAAIQADEGQNILVFMHDDVWIDDFFFADRIVDGLKTYDVIGVAGNRRTTSNQPYWGFIDETFGEGRAQEFLSGAIGHAAHPFGPVNYYGVTPAEVELLDGVFLAARKDVLRKHGLTFDTRYDFHFYDLDFCRAARAQGLHLGTWPICLTHQSEGAYQTDAWRERLIVYWEKWGA